MRRLALAVLVLLVLLAGIPASADFAAQVALCAEPSFVARVRQSIAKAAIAIQNEADTVTNHAQRAQYGYTVLHDPYGYATKMCPGIVSDDGDYSTDAALDSRLGAVWNSYAMVDP